jgi:hypothetical protein
MEQVHFKYYLNTTAAKEHPIYNVDEGRLIFRSRVQAGTEPGGCSKYVEKPGNDKHILQLQRKYNNVCSEIRSYTYRCSDVTTS